MRGLIDQGGLSNGPTDDKKGSNWPQAGPPGPDAAGFFSGRPDFYAQNK
jgi:hypothetical protein